MVNASPGNASQAPNDNFQATMDWSTAFVEGLMRAQRVQLEALNAWQQSVVAVNKELWDQWTCCWTGGVSIDA